MTQGYAANYADSEVQEREECIKACYEKCTNTNAGLHYNLLPKMCQAKPMKKYTIAF